VRNKTRSSNTFPPPLPSSRDQLQSRFSPSSPQVAQGDGEWGLWSVHHTLSLPLLPPQREDSSTLCPCSSLRSLSRETVLHKLLQRESFPQAAALHRLPQRGSFPQGAVPQEQAAPAWVPHRVKSPASKPAPAWAPLSVGPQVLAAACSSTGSPWGHSFLQASTCSGIGSLPQATGGDLLHRRPPWTTSGQPASPWSSSQAARENSLLQHLENVLPLPLHWPWYLQTCFSHIVSLLSLNCHFSQQFFFLPLLNYVITEALPPSLIGLALASSGSILELAGTGSIRHGGSFSQLLTEATPIAPPLPKPCHTNP